MKNNLKRFYGAITAVSIIAGFMAGSVSKVYAENSKPDVIPPKKAVVLPPGDKPYGMTYGEWSARWWQWAYSLSVDENPFYDVDGNCSHFANGQSGPVWFLTGVINESGTTSRICNNVPADKALFFPILNAECSKLEDNVSDKGLLRKCTEVKYMRYVDVTRLAAEIDGVSVQNLPAYRALSPLFTYGPLPASNVLQSFGVDAPEGATSPALADGFYLMLAPLSVGQHTIHFHGEFGAPINFRLDITYVLNVDPRRP